MGFVTKKIKLISLLGKYDELILSYFMYYFLFFYYMTLTRKLNYVGKPKNNTCVGDKTKRRTINKCFRKNLYGKALRGGAASSVAEVFKSAPENGADAIPPASGPKPPSDPPPGGSSTPSNSDPKPPPPPSGSDATPPASGPKPPSGPPPGGPASEEDPAVTAVAAVTTELIVDDEKINKIEQSLTLNWVK